MRVISKKPSQQQIEEMFNNSHETLYLEGIKNLSRKEISRYHSKILHRDFKDSNFIIVKDRNGSFAGMAVFHNLEWDTKCLRQNVARIELIATSKKATNREGIYRMLLDEIFSTCRANKVRLVFLRNSINNGILNKYLTSIGVYPLSVLLNLYRSFDRMEDKKGFRNKTYIEIRRPERKEHSRLEEIMLDGFKNRLLHEPLLNVADVRNLYRQWIRNDLKGRVKEVLIALNGGQVTGFVAFDQLNINGKKYGFVDMIVVDRRFRKKGIGTILVNEVAERLRKITKGIFLGTELENAEALNFYMCLGFCIADSYYSYHIKLDNKI